MGISNGMGTSTCTETIMQGMAGLPCNTPQCRAEIGRRFACSSRKMFHRDHATMPMVVPGQGDRKGGKQYKICASLVAHAQDHIRGGDTAADGFGCRCA